jgi:hypothetical protein
VLKFLKNLCLSFGFPACGRQAAFPASAGTGMESCAFLVLNLKNSVSICFICVIRVLFFFIFFLLLRSCAVTFHKTLNVPTLEHWNEKKKAKQKLSFQSR